MAASQVKSRERLGKECRDRWEAGLDGTSRRANPFLPLPQLCLPLQPLEPVRSWGNLVAWVPGGQAGSCPQMLLDFPPGKSSSDFLGKLWEAPWRC